MYKYIILCISASLSGVICVYNIEDDAQCYWDGMTGQCVRETKCLTSLDERSTKQPICKNAYGVHTICCTDCDLVNDTRNAVITPNGGLFWKTGQKARDHCLQYLKELPYNCKREGQYGGIKRELDEKKQCHQYSFWAVGGSPPPEFDSGAEYPHQALLGFGEDLQSVKWLAGGSIISDRYVLTAGHSLYLFTSSSQKQPPKFVAINVRKFSDSSTWQTHKVELVIPHPSYEKSAMYYDTGLVKTETPIKFNKDVLPACLHVEKEISIKEAIATTWKNVKDPTKKNIFSDTIQTIKLEEFTKVECKEFYNNVSRQLKDGYDSATQMCYGSRTNPSEACLGLSGEPLMVTTQFSRCVHTIIGITSFGSSQCGPKVIPDVYTRVSHYVPWIEDILWP